VIHDGLEILSKSSSRTAPRLRKSGSALGDEYILADGTLPVGSTQDDMIGSNLSNHRNPGDVDVLRC
jgi:hypothetical protein